MTPRDIATREAREQGLPARVEGEAAVTVARAYARMGEFEVHRSDGVHSTADHSTVRTSNATYGDDYSNTGRSAA